MENKLTTQEKALSEYGIDHNELRATSPLNSSQYTILNSPTPKTAIKKRPAKGSGEWDYVPTAWVIERLNLAFGFNWSFEVTYFGKESGEAIVQGKLTVNFPSGQIVKQNFGNHEIRNKKGTDIPPSIGNDYKAAASDCLKKCATNLGIALDLYLDELATQKAFNMKEVKEIKGASKKEIDSAIKDVLDKRKENNES